MKKEIEHLEELRTQIRAEIKAGLGLAQALNDAYQALPELLDEIQALEEELETRPLDSREKE